MLTIKTDSRTIQKGDTFVAIKGYTVDGHDYILEAIQKGASKIVCEKGNYDVETIVVEDTKTWLQNYIVSHYQDQVNKLKIIGVTGTNGKTTTCFVTYQILKLLGVKVAYMGTIGFYCNDEIIPLANTTPQLVDVYQCCLKAIDSGCTHLVMEVSSHALDQNRVEGLQYCVGAFTNLTEDHLDYHKDMNHYLQSKLCILKQLKKDGIMITNVDDPNGKQFLIANSKSLGYQGVNYTLLDYQSLDRGTQIDFAVDGHVYQVNTNLRSEFNVYNFLMSLAIVHSLGYSVESILHLSIQVVAPKGRCEQIILPHGEVIIDYAHTPDAVDKILSSFMKDKNGQMITILGCGGDRDPLKRPIMGHIAVEKSDYVIFTSDNPRTEDPNQIIEDILKGVHQNNYEVEIDRRKAIEKGLQKLKDNDLLLILGKGHETYQIIGTEKIHFSDYEEVMNFTSDQ